MENLLKQLEILRERAIKTTRLLDIDGKESKIRDLKLEINKPDFWNNREEAIKVSKKLKRKFLLSIHGDFFDNKNNSKWTKSKWFNNFIRKIC